MLSEEAYDDLMQEFDLQEMKGQNYQYKKALGGRCMRVFNRRIRNISKKSGT